MGRKAGGIASIFSSKPKHAADSPSSAPWPWPSCVTTPETASFRRPGRHGGDDDRPCTTAGRRRSSEPAAGRLRPPRDEMYKTVNSVYFDAADSGRFFFDDVGAGDPVLADGGLDDDDDDGFSTTTASEEWSEAVIRSLGRTSTDRFFFDSGPAAPASNSILAASPSPGRSRTTTPTRAPAPPPPLASRLQALSTAAAEHGLSDDDLDEDDEPASTSLVEESVAVALESSDPFGDFRASMEEMVAAHGLHDWPDLQEMLLWYLRINGKRNHALIVGAFVDLLVGLATNSRNNASASTAETTTTTATMTTTASACSSSTTSSSSSSSASSSGGDVITTTAAAAATMAVEEQCGGGSVGASCSSASSSDLDEEEEKASDGQCTKQWRAS